MERTTCSCVYTTRRGTCWRERNAALLSKQCPELEVEGVVSRQGAGHAAQEALVATGAALRVVRKVRNIRSTLAV